MKYIWRLTLLGFSLGLAVGCGVQNSEIAQENPQMAQTNSSPSPKTRSYSKNLDEFRKKFNSDKDKVRLVTLLSPT